MCIRDRYNETNWPLLHDAIFALNENDDPSNFLDAVIEAPGSDGASITGHINCLDTWALYPEVTLEVRVENELEIGDELEEIAAQDYPLLGQIDLGEQGNSCDFYGSIDPPVFEGEFDGGDIPILVIGNVSDPITPFVQSEQYANDVLGDGRLVRVEHPAHVVYPSNGCVNDLVHAALIDQEFPTEEIDCGGAEAVDDVVLVPFELVDGSTTVVPDGWREIGDGVFASGDLQTQPVLLVQPTFGEVETVLGGIEQIFGAPAEPAADLEVNGVTWERFSLEAGGLAANFLVRPGADGVIILGQSLPDDIDLVVEQVVIPAVEAFEPAG